jgi:hypothetical protein
VDVVRRQDCRRHRKPRALYCGDTTIMRCVSLFVTVSYQTFASCCARIVFVVDS